jgi:hypothetical protein
MCVFPEADITKHFAMSEIERHSINFRLGEYTPRVGVNEMVKG